MENMHFYISLNGLIPVPAPFCWLSPLCSFLVAKCYVVVCSYFPAFPTLGTSLPALSLSAFGTHPVPVFSQIPPILLPHSKMLLRFCKFVVIFS